MADAVKLIECPRDAWQGLPGQIPTAVKVEYLRALVAAGFKHIDAVSFVSPKAVPQMADSETVLIELDLPDDVEIIGIVVNERGAERAIATDAVRTLGFPYSLSPTFLKNNQNQTLEENLDELITGISLLADMDLQAISLADTVGLATPQQIADMVGPVLEKFEGVEIGVHLHSRPDEAAAKVIAAYDVGCRRFDAAIGGLGGCPFAQDVLVGNIPTEKLLEALRSRGADLPLRKPITEPFRLAVEIANRYSGPKM